MGFGRFMRASIFILGPGPGQLDSVPVVRRVACTLFQFDCEFMCRSCRPSDGLVRFAASSMAAYPMTMGLLDLPPASPCMERRVCCAYDGKSHLVGLEFSFN